MFWLRNKKINFQWGLEHANYNLLCWIFLCTKLLLSLFPINLQNSSYKSGKQSGSWPVGLRSQLIWIYTLFKAGYIWVKHHFLQRGTLANCEDTDKMPHNAAFHQRLHCLLRQNDLQRKTYTIISWAATQENLSSGFPIRSYQNQTTQLQRLASILEFCL